MAHVGLVLLGDRDDHGGAAEVARDEGGLLEPALDAGDVAHTDEGAVGLFEDDRVEDLLDGPVVAGCPDGCFAELVLQGTGGEVLVLAADALGDVGDRETMEVGPGAVDEDPDLPLLEAADVDLRDARDLPDAGLDLLGNVAEGEVPHVAGVAHDDEDDVLDLGGDDLPEARLLGVERQVLGLVDRASDVVDRRFVVDGLEVLVDVEADHRDVRLGGRTHLLDVADRDQLFLELRGHEAFDFVRGRSGPLRGDDDLIQDDVVEVLDLRQLERVPASDHAHEEEDVDEDRLPDAELGQGHRTSTRMPLRSWSTAVTTTRAPSSRPLVTSTRSGRKGTGRVETRRRRARFSSSRT